MLMVKTTKLQQLNAIARFTAFDTSTEEGRSKERHRRIFLTFAASAFAKVISVGTALISIPLTLHYLGTERFGLWMTISSVIAMLGFADLGIGNGLLNAISEANGRDDHAAIRRYISSAFVILSSIALVILLVFSLVYPFVSWESFFNVKSPLAMQESGFAVAVFMLCFVLNIPGGIVQRAQMGLQMGFVANVWQAAGSILGLCAVLLVIHFEMGLPWLVGAMAGGPVMVVFLNGILFFGYIKPGLKPKFCFVCRDAMKKIAHIGLLFLILQVVVSIAFASDNVVIARMLGAGAVAQYAVPEKMFSVIPMILGMVLAPLWPAYGEALSRGDGQWIRKTLTKSLKLAIVFSLPLASIIVIFGPSIISAWVGHEVVPPFLLLLGLGLWKVFEACGNALAMFLNGTNVVRVQVIVSIVFGVIAISLKILLVGKIGIAGTVWATIIAYFIFVVLPYSFLVPRLLKRITIQNDICS
jgi:O-antigen/teichoic acid export membrane protein